MSNVSLVNGHIDRTELTDNEISKRRIKAIYPHITVGGTIDKPCYSIDWYDVDENMMHSGFSSYNLEFVRKWLEEEFEVVEADIDNLINRQKAEIEKLENIERIATKTIETQSAEIERLQKEKLDSLNSQFAEMYATTLKIATKKAKSEAIKEFAERVNPIIEELVDIMFDDNHSKCMIKNCHKHSSVPCESVICIDENKRFWKLKIYNLLNEMLEGTTPPSDKSDTSPTGAALGKWLINPDGYYPYCSECKNEVKKMTKFCPECGAYMGKPQEEFLCLRKEEEYIFHTTDKD